MTHSFDYSHLPGPIKTLAPVVPITFTNGENNIGTFALVDSGADSAIMSTVIADDLGIDWSKLNRKIGYTSSGQFYFRTFKNLLAEIKDNEFMMDMNIIEGVSPYKCILGRNDLFKKADINFKGRDNKFEITFRELN